MDMQDFYDEMFPKDSNKEMIIEEMHLEKEWFEQAKKIKTVEELSKFVDRMLNGYNHDYRTACHAIAACALAAAWLGADAEGITGFQAGFVMWDFIRNWVKEGNECGLRLIDYDDFLYPQYSGKFEKTIDRETWYRIQAAAKKNLEERSYVCDSVVRHWRSIVEGIVPFGYKIVDK